MIIVIILLPHFVEHSTFSVPVVLLAIAVFIILGMILVFVISAKEIIIVLFVLVVGASLAVLVHILNKILSF